MYYAFKYHLLCWHEKLQWRTETFLRSDMVYQIKKINIQDVPLIPTEGAPAATAAKAYSIWTNFPEGLKNEWHAKPQLSQKRK